MVYQPSEKSELYKPSSPEDFIQSMAVAGADVAARYDYPLPAMIGCACVESTFGTSPIYLLTGCPFNLQKPKDWKFPQCATRDLNTRNKKSDTKNKPAPFCVADNLMEAARLWCEWIYYWANPKAKAALEAQRKNPVLFASSLHLVGFAASDKAETAKFGAMIGEKNLMRFNQ